MKKLALVSFVLGLAHAGGCGGGEDEKLPEVDCSGTIPTYAEIKTTALSSCVACHATTIQGARPMNAPANVNFDTYAEAKKEAEEAAAEVNEGAMPPTGFPKLTDAQAQALYKWALCGTPE